MDPDLSSAMVLQPSLNPGRAQVWTGGGTTQYAWEEATIKIEVLKLHLNQNCCRETIFESKPKVSLDHMGIFIFKTEG